MSLQTARYIHIAVVVGCAVVVSLALASERAQPYVSARQWLAELSAIDLDKWVKNVENRQSVSLNGPFVVSPVLEEEADRVQVSRAKRLYVREQVTVGLYPSTEIVREATMQDLLASVFKNADTPATFHPDKESLRRSLHELFSEETVASVEGLTLSGGTLDFDSARDADERAVLLLEWFTINAGKDDEPVLTQSVPLTGTYQEETLLDFDEWVGRMHPKLAQGNGPWTVEVREHLSPVWEEIKDKSLIDSSTHIERVLSKTRGSISLPGVTIRRQQMLMFSSLALLLLLCGMMISVMQLDREAAFNFPVSPPCYQRLVPALTFLTMVLIPIMTFGYLFLRSGEPGYSSEFGFFVFAAVTGAICAFLSFWRVVKLRRPKLTEADRRRAELVKAKVVDYGRATMRPSRIFGRVILTLGLIAGPVGAVTFSIHLIGLAVGSQVSGVLPVSALLLSPVFVIVGWVLAAGRKELILFLRRFGNETLNDSVRDLVKHVLRKRSRLVTLDDSDFEPVGPRWRGLLLSLIPSGLILGAIALGYADFAKTAQSELQDETLFGSALTLIQLGILFVGAVASLVAALLVVGSVRANFVSHMAINDDSSRARVLKRLRKLHSLVRAPVIAAPMATVVSVTNAEWRATVLSIARMCDVTLIDISQPSESIHWELETLREAGVRIILLAQREAVASWWDTDDQKDRLAAQMRSLTAGLPLVKYDAPESLDETGLLKFLSESIQHGS